MRTDDVTLPMFLSTFSLQGGKLRKILDKKSNLYHTRVPTNKMNLEKYDVGNFLKYFLILF